MSKLDHKLAEQPGGWRLAADIAADQAQQLPAYGVQVAVVGCGASYRIAQAYAELQEDAGHGDTDAFPAFEMPLGRA